MITKCGTCGVVYNDARSWTICPHNPLGTKPDAGGFCRRHDLFGPCPICEPNTPRANLHPQTAAIVRDDDEDYEYLWRDHGGTD